MPQVPIDLPEWPDKDPTDKADYALTFAKHLPAGDALSSVSWVSMPAGLTLTEPAVAGAEALVTVADGVAGMVYRLEATVTSAAGRILQRSATLLVRDQ